MYNRPRMSRKTIEAYYLENEQKIQREIFQESNVDLLNIDSYYKKYSLNPIVIDKNKEKKNNGESKRIKIEVPIIENNKIDKISKLESLRFPDISLEKEFSFFDNKITFYLNISDGDNNIDPEEIKKNKKSKESDLKELISCKNTDIEKGNKEIKKIIEDSIEKRIIELEEDKKHLASVLKEINED